MPDNNYNTPWGLQKQLKEAFQDTEVPSIAELERAIESIEIRRHIYAEYEVDEFLTMRARALVALYYLTGCRSSELIQCKKLIKHEVQKKVVYGKLGEKKVLYDTDEFGDVKTKRWVKPHEYGGIRKSDIAFTKIDGKRCMVVRTENRKNRNRKTKRLPVPIDKEKGIAVYVYRYWKTLKEDDYMFPFGRDVPRQIFKKYMNSNIHFIRHIRATHLITLYDFNEQTLVRFMGWTDSRPAKAYMELKSSDLFRQFYKGQNV